MLTLYLITPSGLLRCGLGVVGVVGSSGCGRQTGVQWSKEGVFSLGRVINMMD